MLTLLLKARVNSHLPSLCAATPVAFQKVPGFLDFLLWVKVFSDKTADMHLLLESRRARCRGRWKRPPVASYGGPTPDWAVRI